MRRTGLKIVIVMPAYNAGKTVEGVFSRIPRDFLPRVYKFIVVNDGSTDDTVQKLEFLKKRYRNITVLTHPANRGYGQAQKTGFTEALRIGADVSVVLHSDGQYPPEKLPDITGCMIEQDADVVIGSRMLGGNVLKGGMPLHRYIGNRILTAIENLAYGTNVAEYHTGFMAYSGRALRGISFTRLSDTFHWDGEMVLVASKKKMKIAQIAIPTYYGSEKSYVKSFSYGIDVLKIMIKNFLGKYNF